MQILDIIKTSLNDFFSKKIILVLLSIVIISLALVWLVGGYILIDTTSSIMEEYGKPITGLGTEVDGIIGALSTGLALITGWFVGGYLTFLISILMAGMLTPTFLKIIIKRRGDDSVAFENFGSVLSGIGYIFIMAIGQVLLLIVSLPLIIVGIYPLILIGSLYILFQKVLVYDVGSSMMNKKQFKADCNLLNPDLLKICGLGFVLSYIPLIAWFSGTFTVIMLINYFYAKKDIEKQLKTEKILNLA
jgi:hypothetical protein